MLCRKSYATNQKRLRLSGMTGGAFIYEIEVLPMNFLEERIVKDGIVKPGNVLKVDSFLNHQMDVALLDEIGREFKRRFADKKITKVLTIEASGIAIAYPVAREFGVPLVFAKKSKSINIEGECMSLRLNPLLIKTRIRSLSLRSSWVLTIIF